MRFHYSSLCLLLSGILLSTPSYANHHSVQYKAADIEWGVYNKAVITRHIIPNYRVLAEKTETLSKSYDQLCKIDDVTLKEHHLKVVQSHFIHTYTQWQKVQHIRFGPMAYLKRKERFQYWPDKHAVGSKQLRRLLATTVKSAKVFTLDELKNKSVAIQGLPALERLLFGTDNTMSHSECLLGHTISLNINDIAQENLTAWVDAPVYFMNDLLHPDSGLGIYQTHKEISGLIVNSLTTQIAIIQQLKIERALGKKHKANRTIKLEAWRSQQSLAFIHHNLLSLYNLYQLGFKQALFDLSPELEKAISAQFSISLHITQKDKYSLFELLGNESRPTKIVALIEALQQLNQLLSKDMLALLDLPISFNALDGD